MSRKGTSAATWGVDEEEDEEEEGRGVGVEGGAEGEAITAIPVSETLKDCSQRTRSSCMGFQDLHR